MPRRAEAEPHDSSPPLKTEVDRPLPWARKLHGSRKRRTVPLKLPAILTLDAAEE